MGDMFIDLSRIDNKMKIKWWLACFKGAIGKARCICMNQ